MALARELQLEEMGCEPEVVYIASISVLTVSVMTN